MTSTNHHSESKNKVRCGMVLMKYDHSQNFTCAYCHKDKTSKKFAFEEGNPSFKICNACYGEVIAKYEKK